jgi:RNA polymerase sigma factor (sigma-70 family)
MCARAASVEGRAQGGQTAGKPADEWPDRRLVRECLRGSEQAWAALIDKYKRLIFSIPIKYGLSAEDATDIFQNVCVELLEQLPKLREPAALPKWILQITAHKCLRQKRRDQRLERPEEGEMLDRAVSPVAEKILREAEEEHWLRMAMGTLSPRCRQLIEMLFLEEPARPYKEVAASLGIRIGSIGFIRMRCLKRLRTQLEEAGFQ